MSATQPTPARPWFGLIRKGESSVAPAGMALIGIVAVAMVAAGWWAMRSQSQTLHDARIEEVHAAGDVLADAVEALVQAGEVSALRRLVMNAAQRHGLDVCRVALPGGGVLADADPSQITVTALPDSWVPGDAAGAPAMQLLGNQVAMTYPLHVPQRGGLTLELSAGPRVVESQFATEAGIGTIGVVAMVVLLLVYRQMLGQVRPLSAISESLQALGRGESASSALTVSPRFGRLAEHWNRLIDERQGKWEHKVEEDARAAIEARRTPGGDLADACNALAQGMVIIDEHGQVAFANGAAAVFLGHKREAMAGSAWRDLAPGDALADAVHRAIHGGTRQRRTLEIERGNGAGLLRFAVRPICRGESPAALVIIDDITQQRVAEQARNTFIAQATHELRMPLTNIRLYVETALESGDDDPKLRAQCLNVINSESRRLEGLVSDMLNISEIEAGSLKLQLGDLRLDAMFEELENDFRAKADEKQINMVFNLPPKLPVIQADRERVMIALQNLLGNALKYTPEGGKVGVTVEAVADALSVEVKDSGFGIGETDALRVFDRFYRADDKRVRETTGSGLGLALSREVARLHGGDITVESQIDHGSTFTLTLPINAEAV